MDRSDNSTFVILGIIAILVLYFICNVMYQVEPIIFFLSILVLIHGLYSEDGQIAFFGVAGAASGLIIWAVSGAGIGFFENNLTGMNLLDFGNMAINATRFWIDIF